jgi:hypothetical protein
MMQAIMVAVAEMLAMKKFLVPMNAIETAARMTPK